MGNKIFNRVLSCNNCKSPELTVSTFLSSNDKNHLLDAPRWEKITTLISIRNLLSRLLRPICECLFHNQLINHLRTRDLDPKPDINNIISRIFRETDLFYFSESSPSCQHHFQLPILILLFSAHFSSASGNRLLLQDVLSTILWQ